MEFRTLHAALVVLVATMSPGAADSRFCIVPVKDGQPTAADLGDTWRIHAVTFRIPGLPALVFAGLNRGGRWTITNRRLVRYEGPFPHFADDERGSWVVEPWSSRVVAVTFDGGASVLESGSDHFDRIDERRVRGPYLLPRRKVTVVTDLNSLPFVVMEDRSLKPWVSPEWLASHDIRGIQAFYDSPFLSATIVHSSNARLNVLGDNGAWQEVAKLDVRDFGTVFDAPTSGASIFLGSKSVVAIRKRGLGDSAHFSGELLFAGDGADQRAKPSSLFGRLLTYDRGSDGQMRWRHLGNSAFEDIPGGAIPVPYPKIAPYGNIRDLPLLRRTLIDSGDGLFLYDGSAIVPVPDSGRDQIGSSGGAVDLPSIGKTLLMTSTGVFELTPGGGLKRVSLPPPTHGLVGLADWPEARAALLSTGGGLYALDGDLRATFIPGTDTIGISTSNFAVGVNAGSGEMVLSARSGLYLTVDSVRPDAGSCDPN